MVEIIVGHDTADTSGSFGASGYTLIQDSNSANGTGIITSIEIWPQADLEGTKVGTFYGSGTSYTCRDYAVIGNVTSGSKQTITGLSIEVQEGDFIGIFYTSGEIGLTAEVGYTMYYDSGDQTETGTQSYTNLGGRWMPLKGIGETIAVGTNMKINIGDNFKDIDSIQINIGNSWKDVVEVQQNIGDAWKTVY